MSSASLRPPAARISVGMRAHARAPPRRAWSMDTSARGSGIPLSLARAERLFSVGLVVRHALQCWTWNAAPCGQSSDS